MDTVVYRGGDTASSWLLSGLKSLGFGIAGVSLLAVPLAGLWAMVGALLGRKHAQLLEQRGESSTSP
jgi:AAA family ATP:ADP antiporter